MVTMNPRRVFALIAIVGAFQGCSCEANFQAGGAQAPANATSDGGEATPSATPAPAPAPAPAPMPVGRASRTLKL